MTKIFHSFWSSVLVTTLVVGINDILLAFIMITINSGQFPSKMLMYMAGGALGVERALAGGFWTGALGLLFHFIISFAFTLLVFIIFPMLKIQKSKCLGLFFLAWATQSSLTYGCGMSYYPLRSYRLRNLFNSQRSGPAGQYSRSYLAFQFSGLRPNILSKKQKRSNAVGGSI